MDILVGPVSDTNVYDFLFILMDSVIVYVLIPIDIILCNFYTHKLKFRRMRKTIFFIILYSQMARAVVLLSSQDLNQRITKRITQGLPLGTLGLSFILFARFLAAWRVDRAQLHHMHKKELKMKYQAALLIMKITHYLMHIFLLIRERYVIHELYNLRSWQEIIKSIIVMAVCILTGILYIMYNGFERVKRRLSGMNLREWRLEWRGRFLSLRVDHQHIRQEIQENKKKYVLFNDYVIDISSMNMDHCYPQIIEAHIGIDIFPYIEAEKDSLIGEKYHSQLAMDIIKQNAVGRLKDPIDIKYPLYSHEHYDKQEVIKLVDKELIGEDVYQLTFTSDSFYYFMARNNRGRIGKVVNFTYKDDQNVRMRGFTICNRLINFRLAVKNTNPKLEIFKRFKYRTRNNNTDSFKERATNERGFFLQEDIDESSNLEDPEMKMMVRKKKSKEVLLKNKNRGGSLGHEQIEELYGEKYRWHQGEFYTIITKSEIDGLTKSLSYCIFGTEFFAEGPFGLGSSFLSEE